MGSRLLRLLSRTYLGLLRVRGPQRARAAHRDGASAGFDTNYPFY